VPVPVFVRSALFGAATGSRSQLPTALLSVALTKDESGAGRAGSSIGARGVRTLSKSRVSVGSAVGAVVELVVDKLPRTTSRLQPAGIVARILLGAGGGAVLAQRFGESQRAHALLAGASALALSFGGVHYRGAMSALLGSDWPGAIIEDLVAAGLAVTAVRGL
jgi:uncharacterized membrane protein